jgi:hypothetical protein
MVLPGETIAVLGFLAAAFPLVTVLVFPGKLPVSPICFRTTLMMG